MKINKDGLDEMQKERRNSIGNQMFLLMSYALLLNSGLYGTGIRWLPYPADVMVILMACMVIYLVRSITANAYLPSKARGGKTVISVVAAAVLSVVLAISAWNLFGRPPVRPAAENANDPSALILFIVSVSGLLISLAAAVIRKINDKDDGGE